MITNAKPGHEIDHAAAGRRRKLLAGAGGAALALSLLFPGAAWADDYVVNSEAELQAALATIAGNSDNAPRIVLGSSFSVSTATFTLPNKPVTIDTQGFVLTGPTTGPGTLIAGPSGTNTLVLAGNFAGNNGVTSGTLSLTGTGTVTSSATIRGSTVNSAGQEPGIALSLNDTGTFVNNGTIIAGDSISYTHFTTGGNAGVAVSINTGGTLINNSLIQGSSGQSGSDGFAIYSRNIGQTSFIINNGTIRGGSNSDPAFAGGAAIRGIGSSLLTLTNAGTIEGGNGAAAIQSFDQAWSVKIINTGTIRAGAGSTDAIRMDTNGGTRLYLELWATSNIEGNVTASVSGTEVLGFGGPTDASFDISQVSPTGKYRNFNTSDKFEKNGTSTWTLTGTNAMLMDWTINQGTLQVGDGGAASVAFRQVTNNSALVFNSSAANTVSSSISGTGSIRQSGSGTTTLLANSTYSGGTTITGGTLSVASNGALGDVSGALTINGGALQWTGASGSIARTINWGASGGGFEITTVGSNLTIGGPLLGGGALVKSGAGVLTLVGDNTYTGGTTIASGTLNIGNGGTTGSVLGNILNNSTVAFNRTDAFTYAGSITGTGGVAKPNTGALTLTGQNNYGSGTTISGGQFLIAGGGTTISGGATSINVNTAVPVILGIDGAGSAFSTTAITGAANLNRTMTVSVTNGGHLTTTTGDISLRASTVSAASTNTAELIVDGAGSRADVAGGLVLANSGVTNGKLTISGGGALRTAGTSIIGFATGNTRGVPSATISGAGSNWTSTNSLVMSNGDFILSQGGTASFASATFGTATLPATLIVSGAGSTLATTGGDLVIGSGAGTGELVLSNGGAVDLAGSLVLADAGTATGILSIGGAEGQAAAATGAFTAPTVTLGSGTSRLNFNHTDSDYLFSAAISGAGAINQVAGTTNLTGASGAFAGVANVTGGTLRVNGTLGNAASVVNVLNGGRLGGAGTIGGSVIVADGTIAPGNSPGTLTIAGNLTLGTNSLLDYEFGQSDVVGGPMNDLIEVGGDLRLDGTINVTVTPGGEFGVGVYRVLSYGGTLDDQGLALGTTPGGIVQVQTAVGGQVNLVNYAGAALNFWDGNGARGDGTITGGTGVWQAATGNDNWTLFDGSINSPYTDGNFAIFMGAAGTVTVDNSLGAINASGMQFARSGYVITGGTIGLVAPQSIIRVGDGTAAGAGYSATIASALGGSGQLVKTDLGTLVLTGANSYAGGTAINGGVLQVASDANLGDAAGGLSFNNGTLRIAGDMTSNRDVVLAGAATVTTTAGSDWVLGGDIGGTGALTINTSNTVTLTGDATHSGGTTITGIGTLLIGNGGTSGTIAGNIVNNANIRFDRADASSYAGSISGSGSFSKAGAGQLNLTGSSNWAGSAQIQQGELRIASGNTVTAANQTSLSNGGTLTVSGIGSTFTTGFITASGTSGAASTINVENGGVLRTTVSGLALRSGPAAPLAAANLNVTGAGSLADLLGPLAIASSGGTSIANVTISGGGTLRSTGANQMGAAVGNVTAPTLTITGAGSNWTSTGTLAMTNGSFSLLNGGAASFASAVIGSATTRPAALLVSGPASVFTTSGDLTIGTGTGTGVLTLADGGSIAVGGTFTLADNAGATGVLNIGGAEAAAAAAAGLFTLPALDLGSATSRINFNHTNPAYAFAALISGAGSLNQTTGTTILSAANSYSGATNVTGGTLLINGDQSAATGLTTVGANGTLGGTGIIGGNVDMSAGGTLAAGSNGVGTLTINGNLTLGAGSHLGFELGQAYTVGGPLNDLVDVGGNLTLDGTVDVTTSAGGSFDVGIYRLLNYAGALTNNGLVVGTQPAGAEAFVQTSVAGQVNLVNIGGLTLNFWDGAAGPKFDGAIAGGTGIWQAHTGNDNWTDLSGALNAGFSDGAIAIFTGTAGTVTVDNSLGAVTVSGMQFATNGYAITGDAVTLTGAQAVIRVGDGTAAGAGYTATIASALTGASQLVKTDLGTLVLTGANAYTGGTRIEGGTLQIGNGGSITGDVVNNAALVVNRTGTLTLGGAISGSGTLTQTGGGTLILGGVNSYAGGTTVTGASIVQVSSDANLGAAAGVLALQGGTFQAGASFSSGRAITLGSATSNRIDTQGFDVTLSGVIGNGAGNMSGNFLDKIGTGTLTLTGVNSYSNRTLIAAGTLALAGNGTIGAGNLIVGAGTVFDISQTNAGARVIQLNSGAAGTIALGSKVLTLGATLSFSDWSGSIADGGIGGGTGGSVVIQAPSGAVRFLEAQSYTGGTTVNGGTLALVGNGALYAGGAVTVNAGTVFDISGLTGSGTTIGDLSGAGAVALGGKTLRFGTANGTSFTGTIAGSGGLVKSGTGSFTLTGANSYTGTTSVTAGTLLVNGDQSAATGLTTVASGATLGGSGILGGDVLIADGGTLSPGNSPGTLTINGGLTLSAGSTLAYEFGAANSVGSPLNDLVNVGGNLVLDGTINVSVSAGGAFDIGLYRIANYGGTLTNNGLAIGTMPAGAELSVQTSIAGQVNLVNTGSAVLNFWDGNTGPKFDGAIAGGGGIWRATGTDNWTDVSGAVNSAFDNGAIAIFAGAVGNVTIDNSQGAVTAAGLQFAAHGDYVIQGGTLTLTGPQSVIRVGDGSVAGIGYSANIQSVIAGNTQLVKTDIGRLILAGANSYTGGTAINGGVLEIASDANLGAASGGLSFNGGTLNTTADIGSARAVTLDGQGVLATDAGTTLTLSGAITGAGNLAKTGTGTLVLGGTGSFTGGTQVAQGTLLVNGNFAATTGVTTVAAGATLGGTGTIGGNVTLNGTLSPGAGGAGTLTIGGNLAIAQGATLAYEFGSANVAGGALNDLVNVGGNLVLDGTINVSVPAGGAFSAGIYRVFNYGGTLTDNGLTLGALPAGSNVAVQTSVAGQVNLVNFAGLTLNFWDGAAGPKNNGSINGGTGIWQNGTGNDNWADASGAINAAYSDGAFAVFGGTAGTVTVDNGPGQVAASGMQFAVGGYTVTGGSIALAGAQAVIRVGDGSTAGAGYTATINAALTGASQLVKTDAGTLVLGGTNSYTGGTLVTGGTVQIASDANLGAASGGLTLDGGTLVTTATLASTRNLVLQGAGTLSTATGTSFTLGGVLSGTGNLTKAGTGTLVLGGASAGYAGIARVSAGTLAVTGVLGGSVNVDAAGRLEGTGTVGNVTNSGTIAPGLSGVGTLTLTGTYTGAKGTLEIEAELGGDGARADQLVVGGATAGTTLVKVTNLGGTGAPTVEGIKIVDVAGASNGVFTLEGDYVFEGAPALIAGAYGYRLYKNGVANPADGDWYLRSALLSPVAPPATPLYQPGVPVYEAYGQTLATLNAIGTMQERVGNRRWSSGSDGISGIWGRMESARSRPNAVQSTSLSDVNVDSWKVELGVDRAVSTRGDGSTLVVGVLGSYGEARANIASPFGNGSIKTRGYGAGATLSWFGPQGFYVDSRAQFTWFDSKLKSSVLGKLADGNDGTGQAYSVEVGKRSPLSSKLSVTPQIQMTYSTVGFDRFTDPNGAEVSSRLGDSLKTRWGISLDRQDAGSHLYAVANLSYEWLDGTVTQVSGTPIARSNERLWGEFGLGGSVQLGRVTLYSQVSADTALRDFGKSYSLKGTGGLRLAF
ncbi:fibronectin-binding autotransporter adhesin [Sphingomonas kyeonggiensis]|uniref:autotransporter outer membrane beta-barrel domain-containing protein n=1 Tax=Sphingomonas kyeonggiensis TaxID=1268553 RepID=UPI00277EBF93|nr:autotransporter outer membrane beta-barrel domain-containing protein [Sphingomonas kyeonggiensis]MDQ0251937.1 fibronectin-binding autotransporter adhesin [Sphingomonas kyeonggiensis]